MSVVSATEDTNDILNSKDNIDCQLILKEEYGCNVLNADNIETKQYNSSLSFKNLNQTINANDDSIIDLYDNYAYAEGDDDFIFGVEINREVTIDGHGITIDGANTARMFKVTAGSKVVFQNINFINGYVDINHQNHYGGAIYFYKNSFAELDNCYFNNNHANMGGAVYIGLDSIVEIDNCIFINNTAEGFIAEPMDPDDGGAIGSDGKLTRILNSKFNNNIAISKARNGASGGAPLSVTLNGKTTNYTTDIYGQVKISTNDFAPNTYSTTIAFAGDDSYVSSSKTVNVVVNKATPIVSAPIATFKVSVKTKSYSITLKNNKNEVMKNAYVSFKVNGKTYYEKTNAKGQATFKITNLNKKGTFTAEVKYDGNSYYNAVTVKPKITVK